MSLKQTNVLATKIVIFFINSTPKHTLPDFVSVTLSELKYMYDKLNTICTIVLLSASLDSDRNFVVVLVQYTLLLAIKHLNFSTINCSVTSSMLSVAQIGVRLFKPN